MARMHFLCLVWRGLWCGGLAALALPSLAATQLQCDVTYAGATERMTAAPVQDAYAVSALDIRNRFRFKAVVLGEGAQIERINLYIYQNTAQQPVLVQQAKYLPPYAWPVGATVLALTGQQHLYAGPMERELIYSCTLHREAP